MHKLDFTKQNCFSAAKESQQSEESAYRVGEKPLPAMTIIKGQFVKNS